MPSKKQSNTTAQNNVKTTKQQEDKPVKPGADLFFSVYIAGVMQGSQNKGIVAQDYRKHITGILTRHFPNATIIDPFIGHENAINYSDSEAKSRFNALIDACEHQVDVIIAYLPESSMGTAIEMYVARSSALIITITPLTNNWIVRIYSDRVFETIEEFEADCKSGDMVGRIRLWLELKEETRRKRIDRQISKIIKH